MILTATSSPLEASRVGLERDVDLVGLSAVDVCGRTNPNPLAERRNRPTISPA